MVRPTRVAGLVMHAKAARDHSSHITPIGITIDGTLRADVSAAVMAAASSWAELAIGACSR
jgi:hypothetical protein